MCPERHQAGSLLPIAMFILVALSLLLVALLRLTTQTGNTISQEALSLSAFYSAESGAQWSMSVLFYPEVTRTLTDSRCIGTINGSSINLSAPGLNSCTVDMNCAVTTDIANTTSYYAITSTGKCVAAGVIGERKVEVSALLRDSS